MKSLAGRRHRRVMFLRFDASGRRSALHHLLKFVGFFFRGREYPSAKALQEWDTWIVWFRFFLGRRSF